MKPLLPLLLLAVLLAVAPPAAGQDVHPFYDGLLREGLAAFDRQDHAAAARQLRVAAFGLLEEPPRLAHALTYLALAQAELGAAEELEQTVGRLVQIEERFGAYAAADLPGATRARLEEMLLARGRRELDEDRAASARRQAERLLTLAPGRREARCLRGLTRRSCADGLADLEACTPPSGAQVAASVLSCYVELGRWQPARELVASLPPEIRRDRSLAPLLRRLEQAPTPAAAEIPPAAPPESTAQAPAVREDPGPGVPELSFEERETLRRADELAQEARTAGDLSEAWRLVREVADRHPASTEAQLLAGEIAYRSSRWQDAALYLRRVDEAAARSPEVLFYLAVALHETGEDELARQALEQALPDLVRTPFVTEYVRKILGPDAEL